MITQLKMALVVLLALASAQAAALEIVATASSLGALAREVAGPGATLTVLAGPDRDLHQLQAKPSMIRHLRDADLVVALGAELESGWLPAAISGAANPNIQPGKPGYFEAAAQVELLETGGAADRAMGDVHPVGNPHLDLDPLRMAAVGQALAARLGQLDPAGAAGYRQRADAFTTQVRARVAEWNKTLTGAPGAVLYHRDAIYLLSRFGVPLLGVIEPVPGVPPTGRQLSELTRALKDSRGVILFTPYQSPQAPQALARDLGWQAIQLPLEPPVDADGEGYLAHIGRWVAALASVR
ncbi:MAG: zinc ABC transporter substrate-binding protein [Chromatiaceae bacterium]|nr:zinc ABC transporter substrate-binding protein [Chromatiaceae bacterium]